MINLFSTRLLDPHAVMPVQSSNFKATFADAKILELTYTTDTSFLGKRVWFNPALFVILNDNYPAVEPDFGYYFDVIKVCTEQPMNFIGHISEKNFDATIETQTDTRIVIRFKFIATADVNSYIVGTYKQNQFRLTKNANNNFAPNFDNSFASSAYNSQKYIGTFLYVDAVIRQDFIPIALTFIGQGAMTNVAFSLERLGQSVTNFASDIPTKLKVKATHTSAITARFWVINTNAPTNARNFKDDYEAIALHNLPFISQVGNDYNFAIDIPANKFSNSGNYTVIALFYDSTGNNVGSYYLADIKSITVGGIPQYPTIVGRLYVYANKQFQNYIKASVHNRVKSRLTITPQSGVTIVSVTATVDGANENVEYFMGIAELVFRLKESQIGKIILVKYKIVQTAEPTEIEFTQKVWVEGYTPSFATLVLKDNNDSDLDDFCLECESAKIEATKNVAGNFSNIAWADTATVINDEASFAVSQLVFEDSEYIKNVTPSFTANKAFFNINACDGLDKAGIIAINDTQPAMPIDEVPTQLTPPVVSWIDNLFIVDNKSVSFLPCNSNTANWTLTGNKRCIEVSPVGRTNSGVEAEEIDLNPNSPTYNTTKWVFIGNDNAICPLETNPCNIAVWIDTQDNLCNPVYRCKFPTPRTAGQSIKQKQQIQINPNITSGSQAYGSIRWIDVGQDIAFCPIESCSDPFWVAVCPNQVRCKFEVPRTSSMQEQLFRDYNPNSPTYLQSQWLEIGENENSCPTGIVLLLGHYRGEFSPIFDITEKFNDFTQRLILGSITTVQGYRYSQTLTSSSPFSSWEMLPVLTKSQLISAIQSGGNNFSFYAIKGGYSDVSISEGTILFEIVTNAISPFSNTLNFSGISQDILIGLDHKINLTANPTLTNIASAQYRIRQNKNTDWNSIALQSLTQANFNASMTALADGEYEVQVYINYSGSNTSGSITINWNFI